MNGQKIKGGKKITVTVTAKLYAEMTEHLKGLDWSAIASQAFANAVIKAKSKKKAVEKPVAET